MTIDTDPYNEVDVGKGGEERRFIGWVGGASVYGVIVNAWR